VVATALSHQELLDAAAAEDLVLDVGGRSPADVVSDVERFLCQVETVNGSGPRATRRYC